MTRHATLQPEAVTEFLEAVRFYELQQVGLGGRFEAEVAKAVDDTLWNPEAWAILEGRTRPPTVRSRRIAVFPYRIIYFLRDDDIVIVAIAHERRRPDYWKKRVKD